MARPRLSDDQKRLRGTAQPCRMDAAGPSIAVLEPETDLTPTREYVAVADGYVADVLAGRIVAGVWTRKACERFRRMREVASAPGGSYGFSPEEANRICAFAEQCPHVEGKWRSDGITLEPWQVWVLVACYGFRRPDGSRLVTSVFFQVGRKSAKSTLVAVALLYHLVIEREVGAQAICAATTGSQSRIVFGIAQRMVRRSPWLRAFGLAVFANAIVHEELGSVARPINSRSSSQDGLSPSFVSFDESHAQGFELHDVLISAMGARPDGMVWAPTSAGYDLTSIGYSLRGAAMKILDGVVESDHTFATLYELDEKDDWRDQATWIKSLPMVGTTPSLDYLRRYRDDAVATPGLAGEFETKMCGRWLHSASSWLSMDAWDRCADPSLTLEDFVGEPCWMGGDLAQVDDLAAVALVFERDGVLYGFVRSYLPEDVVADRARAVPAYRQWAKSGDLVLTVGNMHDFDRIEADVRDWCQQFDVRQITFDQFGSFQLIGHLSADGLPALLETKNARTFTPPARELEARVKNQRFRHDGNTCLKWQASNCVVSRRIDDSILPKKEMAESPAKIDAIDALILAIGGFLRQPEPARSVYEERGPIFFG